jgi:integrase
MPKNVLAWVPHVTHDYAAGKYWLKQQDIAQIVHAPLGKERVRDTALVAFALSTGARRNEIVNAKVENMHFATDLSNLRVGDDHSGYVHLRVVKGDSEGTGKGRYSAFCSKTGLLLKTWLRCWGESKGNAFVLGYVGLQNITRCISVTCGLPELHPHAFRSAHIDYWAFKHANAGMMASIALKLQVGHAIDGHDFGATVSYINTSNPWRNMEIIKKFHCSPLDEIEIDWARFPVHIEVEP